MLNKSKKIILYATMPIILSLYSQTIGAAQTVTVTETLEMTQKRMVEHARQESIAGVNRNETELCNGISSLLGEYSYSNKPTSKPSTWKQTLGAFLELPAHFLGALFYTPVSGIVQAPQDAFYALKEEAKEVRENGVAPAVWNVGTKVVKAVANDPFSAIILPGSLALGYGNFSQFTDFLIAMGLETAGGMSKAQILYNIAKSMENDSRWAKAAKTVLYTGAAYYLLMSLPLAEAAQFTFGTQFLISGESNIAPTFARSGNTLVVTWGNTTHIKQSFYNANTGALVSGPNVINQNPTAVSSFPASIFLDANSLYNTWVSSLNRIVGRKSFLAGALGSEQTLPAGSTGTYGSPTLSLLTSSNRLMVAWNHNPSVHTAIEYGIFDATTFANLNGDLVLSGSPTFDQSSAVCLPYSGKVICTWQGFQSGNWAPYRAILNGMDGSIISAQTSVNAPITGTDQVRVLPIILGGNPFVFWVNGADLSGVALTSAGTPTGSVLKFNVNSKLDSSIRLGATTADDGTGLVTWTGRVGVANTAIYVSAVTPTFTISEGETAISTGANSQSTSAVVSVPNAGVFAGWSGDDGTGKFGFLGTFGADTAPITSTTMTMTTANATTKPSGGFSNAPGIFGIAALLVSLYATL